MTRFLRAAFLILTMPLFAAPLGSASAQEGFKIISTQGLQTLLKDKTPVVLLDVREPEEYDQGHMDGAVLIPLKMLPEKVSTLPKDKNIVVYCRSGMRSAQATAFLAKEGYANAASLTGGYREWIAAQEKK